MKNSPRFQSSGHDILKHCYRLAVFIDGYMQHSNYHDLQKNATVKQKMAGQICREINRPSNERRISHQAFAHFKPYSMNESDGLSAGLCCEYWGVWSGWFMEAHFQPAVDGLIEQPVREELGFYN